MVIAVDVCCNNLCDALIVDINPIMDKIIAFIVAFKVLKEVRLDGVSGAVRKLCA